MRRALPFLLILALIASAVPVAAQGDDDEADDRDPRAPTADGRRGGTPPSPATPTPGERDEEDEDDRGRGGDERRDADEHRQGPAIGSFEVRSVQREVVGEFLNFSYSDTGVQGYAIGGKHLFNATIAGGDADDRQRHTETVARGSQIQVRTPSFRLQAHDNPGAVTKIETDGRLTLHFPPSVNVTLLDDGRARFQLDGVAGTVTGDDLALADGDLLAGDGVLVFLDTPRGAFDRHREDIGRAIARGHVGAELSLTKREANFTEDVVSYGNVTLTTLKAEQGNLTVLIDGHGFDGRVLVFNVDGRMLGAQRAEDLDIRFDNGSIRQASNLTDILDPDDDGLDAEYYVVFDPQTQAFQLLVTVPHYSVHVLSVGTVMIPLTPTVVVGVLAGVALLAPAGYVLFRRK